MKSLILYKFPICRLRNKGVGGGWHSFSLPFFVARYDSPAELTPRTMQEFLAQQGVRSGIFEEFL